MLTLPEYLFASLLCMLLVSCTDNQVSVDHLGVPTYRSTTSDRDTSWFRYNKDYFPHDIGTQWLYQIDDSTSGTIDSVLLTVVSDSFGNTGMDYSVEIRVGNFASIVHDW